MRKRRSNYFDWVVIYYTSKNTCYYILYTYTLLTDFTTNTSMQSAYIIALSLLCVCLFLLLFHFYCGKQLYKLTFASKTLVRDWKCKRRFSNHVQQLVIIFYFFRYTATYDAIVEAL